MSLKIAIVPVTPFEQNCSILVCDETNQAAIVDPGGDLEKILKVVNDNHLDVVKILITHGHLDHCSGASELSKQLNVPIEGPHKEDLFWIEQLSIQAQRFGFNHQAEPFTPNRWLVGGDTVNLGNQSFNVEHCPGHTPGHIAFINEEAQIAIVGDLLFAGSIGRTDFPRGNHQDLITSIKNNLFKYGDEIRFVPGHGPNSSFGEERLNNPFLQ
jgi:glyoxylase-like metal-dependent hydrolase (beta-lactamase superfamily II)